MATGHGVPAAASKAHRSWFSVHQALPRNLGLIANFAGAVMGTVFKPVAMMAKFLPGVKIRVIAKLVTVWSTELGEQLAQTMSGTGSEAAAAAATTREMRARNFMVMVMGVSGEERMVAITEKENGTAGM